MIIIEGEFITREIFRASVAIDGRFKDITLEERNTYVRNIYTNTKKYILTRGITIPIKLGHWDETQALKGYITELSIKKIKNDSGEFINSIWAKIFLCKPIYDEYSQGRYPGCSIELADEGYFEDGTKFGPHITALAMLGTDMPAFPLLKDTENYSLDNSTSYFTIVGTKTYKIQEYSSMNFDKDVLIEALVAKLVEKLPVLISETWDEIYPEATPEMEAKDTSKTEEEEMGTKEDKKMEAAPGAGSKKEDKKEDEKLAASYARLEKDRIELEFEKLVQAKKLTNSHKSNFMSIADKVGLDVAKSMFESMQLQSPPSQKDLKIEKEVKDAEVTKQKKELLSRLRVSQTLQDKILGGK